MADDLPTMSLVERWRTNRLLRRLGGVPRVPYWVDEGLAVDARTQPDLWGIVDEVGRRLGQGPDRVVLVGNVVAEAWAGPQRVLGVGLPLLLRLSRDELRALLAHELSTLLLPDPRFWTRVRDGRDRVDTLATISRFAATTRLLPDPVPARDLQRGEELLRRTQAFTAAVVRRMDGAAVDTTGPSVAAHALVKAWIIERDFDHTSDLVEDRPGDGDDPAGVVDVHDVWLARLGYGRTVPRSWYADAAARVGAEHPTLAGTIGAVSLADLDLTRTVDAIALHPFTPAERRQLAGHVDRDAVRWVGFADIPADAWDATIRREGADAAERVATTLGRPDWTPGEAIEALATGADAETDLMAYAEDRLTARGWRRVHPVTEGLLVAPDGARTDLLPLVGVAVTDAAARSELAALLPPGGST